MNQCSDKQSSAINIYALFLNETFPRDLLLYINYLDIKIGVFSIDYNGSFPHIFIYFIVDCGNGCVCLGMVRTKLIYVYASEEVLSLQACALNSLSQWCYCILSISFRQTAATKLFFWNLKEYL